MHLTEESVFFQNGHYKLFGFLHHPIKVKASKALILCPPFGEEKQESHRVLVNLAKKLSENGVMVFRFDYFGTGDSEGEWQQATVNNWISDIFAAINFLTANYSVAALGLFGLRFGGTLAALAAEKDSSVNFVILWDPIVNVEAYLYKCLRSNLAAQMVLYHQVKFNREQLISKLKEGEKINLDGYLLTNELYESAKNIHLLKDLREFGGDSLTVQFSGKDSRPDKDLLMLHSIYLNRNPKSAFMTLPTHPFWNESFKFYSDSPDLLFTETLKWLNIHGECNPRSLGRGSSITEVKGK